MPTLYNETLHDKTGCFLSEAIRSTSYLSEGSCNDIRKLFEDEQALLKFIRANVDVDDLDAWDLIDQVYPEEGEAMELHTYTAYEPDHPDADCHGVVTYELD